MKLNGDMLKDARDRKGLTQMDLASKLGISVVTISKMENGGDIHTGTGVRVCDFLEIDLARAVVPRVQEGNGDAA